VSGQEIYPPAHPGCDEVTLADFQDRFNAVGNITQMTDGAGASNYTYDPLDRLTAATHPNQTNESYTFDDVGNRTASHQGSSYSYQAFNRLVAANGATFGYDANGNLTSKTDASGSWDYIWDYENRLKQANKSGGVTVTYAYDALGRRVQRTTSVGATTKFVYDGVDAVRNLDGNGNTVADYLNGPGIDNKLRMTAGSMPSYFAIDHLGTTRAITDASGSLTSTLNYDSFGNVMGGSAPSRYTYTGREADSDSSLMYYRARWYDAQVGRFISEDPVGFKGGVNLYSYAENDPIRFVDPRGTFPAAAAAVAGVIAVEWGIHFYLSNRAWGLFPDDQLGRKKHCYVNCMSTRIHFGIPLMATTFSVAQELPTLIEGAVNGQFRREVRDTTGDLAADGYGQFVGYAIWKSCKELCDQCPGF
jgi:RHS repeat-associated protein